MTYEPTQTSSFADLYRATILPLRRYLGRLLVDRNEAQDIAHDAYLRLYPHLTSRPPGNSEALLYTTARRLALNRLKRRSAAPFDSATPDPSCTAQSLDAAQQMMAHQTMEELERAIAELPAGCRSVLLLRKVEMLSHHEIAERLGIAISTVEKQHARALRLLRTSLQADTPITQAATAPSSTNSATLLP